MSIPNPYTTVPGIPLEELLGGERPELPPGFSGRLGVLVARNGKTGERIVRTAASPYPFEHPADYRAVDPEALIGGLEEAETPSIVMTDAAGGTFTMKELLADWFADYPVLPPDQGGRRIEARKRQWRAAFALALKTPLVRLLDQYNRERAAHPERTLELIAEAWIGRAPCWLVRHDGTFYPPASSFRPVLDRLLEGEAVDPVVPIADEEHLPEIKVLFEDDDIIVVDKPTRLASVPGLRESTSVKQILEKTHGPLWVVHRLDLDTSGVLLFGKRRETLDALNRAFSERKSKKTYVARLEGVPASYPHLPDVIDLPLGTNPLDRPLQAALAPGHGGKEAVTRVKAIGIDERDGTKKLLVELSPETGRTHQLRMHTAHPAGLGVAIDGDPFYSKEGPAAEGRPGKAKRLCLHAASLSIVHPMTGERLTWRSEPDFPVFEKD